MSSSSSIYSSADEMEAANTGGSQAVKVHDLIPPPGEAAAQVVLQASSLQDQLTVERRRFSMKYGKAGEACKPIIDIRQNLQKDDNSREQRLELACPIHP